MIERPSQKIAVVLERRTLPGRWSTEHWDLVGVVPDVGGEARTIVEGEGRLQRLFPGIDLVLYHDEAEGYYLNASTDAPSVFVAMRFDETSGDAYPFQATLSYNEAARWMDGAERVERAVVWPELAAWMAQWVADNYRPEPKQRRRPQSFVGKEGRLRERNGR
jgi:uncharacterized protein DUF3305